MPTLRQAAKDDIMLIHELALQAFPATYRDLLSQEQMDFMMDWRLIDCLRNGLPLDQDVYDAATWSCITPMSEWSVANRSNSIDVPDFTGGSWKTNKPVPITLEGGGTTKVKV